MSELPVYLFVYGTLKPGYANPFALLLHQSSRYVGPGTMPGRLYNIGQYPGALYEPNGPTDVHGTIFDLTETPGLLLRLDEYEDLSIPPNATDEYIRAMVPIRFGTDALRCWAYLYNWPVTVKQLIASGSYMNV